MANPNAIAPKHTQFKKGQSGNPGGKPKGMLTASHVSADIGRVWHSTVSALGAIVADPTAGAGLVALSAIMLKATKGCATSMEMILCRGVGKVKDISEIQHSSFKEDLDKVPKDKIVEFLRNVEKAA